MKTTVELSDALMESARKVAQSRSTTLRALMEEGLRHVIDKAKTPPKAAFRLKDARVKGQRMLLPDPRSWRDLEEDHVVNRFTKGSP
jgi:DNA-binding HxlR family transcriptional regulator